MAPHLRVSSTEAAVVFEFSGSDCLYRDQFGRRVVADVEGCGIVWDARSQCRLLGVRDGVTANEFPWTYDRFATVVAESAGDVAVRVLRGRHSPVDGRAVRVELPYEGSGWLIEAPDSVVLDDRHEPAPDASPAFALPFFRRIDGSGTAKVIPSATRCQLIDGFDIADTVALAERGWKVQNISKLSELASVFADAKRRTAQVASHLNRATWRLRLPRGCEGLILRKFYDRFHGRQRARVLVDGVVAGWWYEPFENRQARWAVSDFGIERDFLPLRDEIEISIDPPPGTPLWSVGRIEVYSLSGPA